MHSALGLKFWAFVVGAAPLPPDLEEFWRRMGFAVIQGYGLTETAPIVTLNHPFKTSKGSVGTPIAGVEVRIADDGEILVRGENVTSGYYEAQLASAQVPKSRSASESCSTSDGWLHTGDIGERDEQGRLFIKGRKKEMIVTPEGLNVFPEDVERVLNELPGVRESAVVGVAEGAQERVHAVLVLEPGVDPDAVIREANARLQDHQRIRAISVWPGSELPRTEGTRKLKRRAIRDWVNAGGAAAGSAAGRLARGADRPVRARPRRQRRHDARGARPELARTRRADGRARGSVPDAHRRGALLRGGQHRRSQAARRRAASRRRRRRAGRLPVLEPHAAGAHRSGGCRRRRGSCR